MKDRSGVYFQTFPYTLLGKCLQVTLFNESGLPVCIVSGGNAETICSNLKEEINKTIDFLTRTYNHMDEIYADLEKSLKGGSSNG